ncbi:MAG: ComEC/Rec2 family competence protein [Planctomycetes bacterium]|nr:ComEC/Rec2 family competence protein [Planctomycetota bacterium]
MSDPLPWEGKHYPVRRPALLAAIAAVAGCALAHLVAPGGIWQLALAVGGCGLLAAAAFSPLRRRPAGGLVAACGLAAVFTAWGGWRTTPAPDDLRQVFPAEAELVRLRGTVLEGGSYLRRDPAAFEYPEAPEPQRDFPVGADPRRNQSWLVRVDELPDMNRAVSGCVKLYAPPETRLPVSSRVEVIGQLRRPRRAGNPGEVDSRARYLARGVTHTITASHPGQVTVLDTPAAVSPSRLAAGVHDFFHERLGARMPAGRAAVLGAAILGERGGLSMGQRADFVRSGSIHLLVVSGMHVALLAGTVVLLLRILGVDPRWGWAAAGAVALLYLGITGLQPGSLRATIMVCLYALGQVLLRRPDALNVLGGSALVALAIDPAEVAELGFQLSYLAVLGIVVIAPCLRLWRPESGPERRGPLRALADRAGASLRVSAGVALCLMPLLAHTVHIVSPVMLVSNLVAGPLVGLVLVLALAIPLAVIPGVDAALALVFSLLGGALELVAGFFAGVPGGHHFVPAPPLWWLVVYYAALAGVVLLPRLGLPRAGGALLLAAWCGVLPARDLVDTAPPGPATVKVLDVGPGPGVVIEVPQGPCVVLDCGSTSLGSPGERVLAPYLWSRGRRQIDTLVLSHADADHVNGLPQLFERFAVGEVVIGQAFDADETGRALRQWLELRAPVRVLRRGQYLELAPRLRLHALWPDMAFVRGLFGDADSRNDAGLVLELEAGPGRVLLPGDVEHRGLAGIVPRYARRGPDVLLAFHQGSAVTGLEDLLARLEPAHVIVSARRTFPDDEAMRAYAARSRVWTTWQDGAVTVTLGADGALAVSGFVAP